MYYPFGHQIPLQPSRIMTVTGVGSVVTEPDTTQIQLEVITEDSQLTMAQQQNAVVMKRVIESLHDMGIPKENIKTTSYTIYPQYDYPDGKQQFRGYQVTNAISVKITTIEQVGNIIDVAVRNGVNNVSTIQFIVENEDFYYQQALGAALKNALTKAQTIAKTMQLQLNQIPIKIVEEFRENPVLFQPFSAKEMSVSTPIEPGQKTINASVKVQFQY